MLPYSYQCTIAVAILVAAARRPDISWYRAAFCVLAHGREALLACFPLLLDFWPPSSGALTLFKRVRRLRCDSSCKDTQRQAVRIIWLQGV